MVTVVKAVGDGSGLMYPVTAKMLGIESSFYLERSRYIAGVATRLEGQTDYVGLCRKEFSDPQLFVKGRRDRKVT